MKRRISVFKIGAIFCLTVLVFILGIVASNITTNIKVTDINKMQDDLKNELLSMELEDRLLEEVSCSNSTNLGSFSEKMNDLATKLTYLETEYEKNDPQIIELKKPYTLLLIRNYLRLKEVVEKCDFDSVAKKTVESSIELLKAKPPPSGEFPVQPHGFAFASKQLRRVRGSASGVRLLLWPGVREPSSDGPQFS